jgi:hypothetical protein
MSDLFNLAGKTFNSRLIIGTGKYRSFAEMQAAHKASGAEMVTVAVNRVPLDRATESFLDSVFFRRSDHGEKASRHRLRGRYAACRADRFGPRRAKSGELTHHARAIARGDDNSRCRSRRAE